MLLTMLKAKLHSATVTQCALHSEGSVSIDQELPKSLLVIAGAGFRPFRFLCVLSCAPQGLLSDVLRTHPL